MTSVPRKNLWEIDTRVNNDNLDNMSYQFYPNWDILQQNVNFSKLKIVWYYWKPHPNAINNNNSNAVITDESFIEDSELMEYLSICYVTARGVRLKKLKVMVNRTDQSKILDFLVKYGLHSVWNILESDE